LTLLVRLLFLCLFEGFTTFDELCLHVTHEFLELAHLFLLLLQAFLLGLLLLLWHNLHVLTLLVQLRKQLFNGFLTEGVSSIDIQTFL